MSEISIDSPEIIRTPYFDWFEYVRERYISEDDKVEELLDLMRLHHLPTYNHLNQVAEYAVFLATKAGFGDDEIRVIRNSALLHDIGKLFVPKDVLNRKSPNSISQTNFRLLNIHAELSSLIIKSIGLNEEYAVIAEQHGYGNIEEVYFAQDSIHRFTPLIAIADVIAASLDSSRPYQQPVAIENLKQYIEIRFVNNTFPYNLRGPFNDLIEKIAHTQSKT